MEGEKFTSLTCCDILALEKNGFADATSRLVANECIHVDTASHDTTDDVKPLEDDLHHWFVANRHYGPLVQAHMKSM